MGVTFYTGRKALLRDRLIEHLRAELDEDAKRPLFVLVPEQLTLETEMLTLDALELSGSFQLNVLSPKRLCARVFDEAGWPDRVPVDERGRAIVMGRALRTLSKELAWYGASRDRRGFEMKLVEEVIRFKQAGVTPPELSELSEKQEDGALKWKLHDLALLYEAYEAALSGHFQDGEDEIAEAVRRMASAESLRAARVFVYGFDITTAIYNRFFAALGRRCARMNVYLPLENDRNARDFSVFQPLDDSYGRMLKTMAEEGVRTERVRVLEGKALPGAAAYFAREAFSVPPKPYPGKNRSVQLAALSNPMEEARFAASLMRRLAMTRGWRYGDMLLLCDDLNTYADALETAFDAYEVPLFLAESRPADRHPLPRFLLESMKIAASAGGDVSALLMTGYADATDEEADALGQYVSAFGLRPRELLAPFRKGDPARCQALEPARARVAEPLKALSDALSRAKTLRAQLTAIFDYMKGLRCAEKGEAFRNRLIELGQRALAAEDAQVWNRVMGTLDQLDALMGGDALAKPLLAELLSRAFSAAQIKPLPQSADAVTALTAARVGSRPAKAVILIGASESGASAGGGLFARAEAEKVSGALQRFLGADALGRTRTDRLYLKNALAMAEEYVCVTYPMSAQDGSALMHGAIVEEAKAIFPETDVRGGLMSDEGMLAMRYGARRAAEIGAAVELSGGKLSESGLAAVGVLAERDAARLDALSGALHQRVTSEEIGRALALQVYGPLRKVSVTRLEAFAGCPFAHFVKYALRPEEDEVYGLNARDEGGFYHEAVRAFLENEKARLESLTPDEAAARMNEISDALLEGALRDVTEDSFVARASAKKMRRTAARAARTLSEQLRGSGFQPVELEMEFGDGKASLRLNTDEGTRLGGRIDRVDSMRADGERYLRVVDYKRGAQKLDAAEAYYGLQLQLILYLAEALLKYGGKCAGAFYFRVNDPVIDTESMDPAEIERLRSEHMRMEGLLPSDPGVIRKMAAEPERVFRVRFLKSGALDARVNAASEREFQLLIRRAVERASELSAQIARGVTEIAPVKSAATDACLYCGYRGACMSDRRIPGGKTRRLKRMTFREVFERLDSDDKANRTPRA